MNIVRGVVCFAGGMVLGFHAVEGNYALALVGGATLIYGIFYWPVGDNR